MLSAKNPARFLSLSSATEVVTTLAAVSMSKFSGLISLSANFGRIMATITACCNCYVLALKSDTGNSKVSRTKIQGWRMMRILETKPYNHGIKSAWHENRMLCSSTPNKSGQNRRQRILAQAGRAFDRTNPNYLASPSTLSFHEKIHQGCITLSCWADKRKEEEKEKREEEKGKNRNSKTKKRDERPKCFFVCRAPHSDHHTGDSARPVKNLAIVEKEYPRSPVSSIQGKIYFSAKQPFSSQPCFSVSFLLEAKSVSSHHPMDNFRSLSLKRRPYVVQDGDALLCQCILSEHKTLLPDFPWYPID